MGAAATRTEPPRAAGHSPAQQNPSSFSFPSFLGRAPSLPSPPPAGSLAPFWLLSAQWVLQAAAARRLGCASVPTPHSSSGLPAPAALPRELTRLGGRVGGWGGGESGFLLRRSQEHYGRARSRLGRQPQPPESGAGTGGGRERGSASREARARSPRSDRRRRRRRSHGGAPRLRPEDQQVKSRAWGASPLPEEERRSQPSRVGPRGRVGVAARAPGSRGLRCGGAEGLAAAASRRPRIPARSLASSGTSRARGARLHLRRPAGTRARSLAAALGRTGGGSSSAGGLIGGASQILCVPTPGAGKAAALRPLALPAHSPRAPRRVRAAALLSSPTKGAARARARAGGGRPSFRAPALPERSDRDPLCTQRPSAERALRPGLVATMKS